jgi:cysteinyl-tRNA synthetase
VEVNPEKRNPLDFALWIKAPKEHILKWESPWGIGYPGWHIECSVMSADLLGQNTFDIHAGGNENAFPHNENEIAQSEAFLEKKMANYWFLWNMVQVDGQKMSKSLGNFTTIKDAMEKYNPMTIRLWILSSHYRSLTNFSEDSLRQAEANFHRISDFVNNLKNPEMENGEKLDLKSYQEKFEQALDDDLNTPVALSLLYELITAYNKKKPINKKEILAFWQKMNKIFGLNISKAEAEIPEFILELAKNRDEAKKIKDFQKSDEIRKAIEEKGYLVEDSKEGYKIKKK